MSDLMYKNYPTSVEDLVKEVKRGAIGLPDLQRPFCMEGRKSARPSGLYAERVSNRRTTGSAVRNNTKQALQSSIIEPSRHHPLTAVDRKDIFSI